MEGTEGVAIVEGVEGVAIGHDHLLLLRTSGWIDHVGQGVGGDSGGGDCSDGSGGGSDSGSGTGSDNSSSGSGSGGSGDCNPSESNTQQNSIATTTTTRMMPPFVRLFSTATIPHEKTDSTLPPSPCPCPSPSPGPLQPSPSFLLQPTGPSPVEKVLKVSAGVRHSAAITTDG